MLIIGMNMKRLFVLILVVCVSFSGVMAQATKKRSKKKVKTTQVTKPLELSLPPRSADCFFAVNLPLDSAFGPTEPLQGFGYVNEIHKDAQTKNVFDGEHNSVWYKIDCPYAGKLIIDVTPKSEVDDYDMLVYKFTDKYFCNRVEKNRVKPIRSILSANNSDTKGKIGLSLTATAANLTKESTISYGRYINVEQGDSYIVVLDNLQDGGLGHTIRAEIYTEHTPLYIEVYDSINKVRTTANIKVYDNTTDALVVDLEDAGRTKLKLLPDHNYNINITKPGYFNYRNTTSYANRTGTKDSVLTVRLAEIKIGSVLKINGELYFEEDENDSIAVMKESYEILDEVAKTLNEYSHMNVEIIGRIATDGLNLTSDTENSRKRGQAIKNYLITKGVSEERMVVRGSTKKELLKQIEEQNKKNTQIFPACEIKIKSLK
jgi:outer membrane protein OmpA-like peptidoglycan-associated protein